MNDLPNLTFIPFGQTSDASLGKWPQLRESEKSMSNCFFDADPGIEEELRTGEVWCSYAGWNFYGYVWFEDDVFKCEVWQYKCPIEIIEASSVDALMHAVSSEYGYD